jgi:hypothetical protein
MESSLRGILSVPLRGASAALYQDPAENRRETEKLALVVCMRKLLTILNTTV